MLTRLAAILTAALSACAIDLEPVAESEQPVICGQLCDPGHGTFDDALFGARDYARGLYPSALQLYAGCSDLGSPGAPYWDCVLTFTMDESSCLLLVVECGDLGGRVSCNHHETNCQF